MKTFLEWIVMYLDSAQEEADTRILLHANDAKEAGFLHTVVVYQDTDVLVLLIAFCEQLTEEVWMKKGTTQHPNYIALTF